MTPREEVLGQLEIQVIDGFASDQIGHGCDTKVLQQSVTVLATPQVLSERAECLHGSSVCYPTSLKPLPHKGCIDSGACSHATWSGPEGSSHSGNIECRGVAGGAASIL